MMRLLFLCLLLPAITADSEDAEGSGFDDGDDEDGFTAATDLPEVILVNKNKTVVKSELGSASKTSSDTDDKDQFTLIVVVVAVSVVTLSVAVIIAIFLVRRRMLNRQQGVYSMPTEQGQKAAI